MIKCSSLVDKMEQFVQCQVENQLNVECPSMKQLMEAAVTQEEKVFTMFHYFVFFVGLGGSLHVGSHRGKVERLT